MPGKRLYQMATVLLGLGIVFAVVCDLFHLSFPVSIPCFFDTYMHIYCPGCGGTRAMYALFRLDIFESIRCNPIVIYGAGLFLYYYIGTTLAVLNKGRKIYFKPGWWMLWVLIVLLVWTTIIRNILAIQFGIDPLGDVAIHWSS